jgi:hypothetical protein
MSGTLEAEKMAAYEKLKTGRSLVAKYCKKAHQKLQIYEKPTVAEYECYTGATLQIIFPLSILKKDLAKPHFKTEL